MDKLESRLEFDYSLDLGPFLEKYPFIIGFEGGGSNEFRAQQVQFAVHCYEGVSTGRDVVVEGPTGLGKTRALLAAVAPFLQESDDNRVIYATRTATQVAGIMKDLGSVLTASEELSHIDISHYVGFKRITKEFCSMDSCLNCTPQLKYDKHQNNNDLSMQVLRAEDFIAVKESDKCPISLMKEKASKAKIVVCTSRYLSNNEWKDAILGGNEKNTVLIIDEAHNFLGDALNVPFLTSNKEIGGHYTWKDTTSGKGYDCGFGSEGYFALADRSGNSNFEDNIRDPAKYFSRMSCLLSDSIMNGIGNISNRLSREPLKNGSLEEVLVSEYDNSILWESIFDDFSKKSSISISRLQEKVKDYLNGQEFKDYLGRAKGGFMVKGELFSFLDSLAPLSKVKDNPYKFATAVDAENFSVLSLDPAEVVDTISGKFKSRIFSSATISPVEDVSYTMGLDNPLAAKIEPVFPSENYSTFIISGVNSSGIKDSEEKKKFTEREERVMSEVFYTSIAAARGRNIGIFCSSNDAVMEAYNVLEEMRGELKFNLLAHAASKDKDYTFREDIGKLSKLVGFGRPVATLDDKIELFRKAGNTRETNILLGVEGGSLSEGVDYKGKEMEMVICVGLPYQYSGARDNINKVRSDYFFFKRGDREIGNDLAYRHDALRKAAQSLGRAHRTKTDRAVLILMDERVLGIKNSKTEDPKNYEYLSLQNAEKNRALLPAAFANVGKLTTNGDINSYVVFPSEAYDPSMIDVVRQGIHAEKGVNCLIPLKDMGPKIRKFYRK